MRIDMMRYEEIWDEMWLILGPNVRHVVHDYDCEVICGNAKIKDKKLKG